MSTTTTQPTRADEIYALVTLLADQPSGEGLSQDQIAKALQWPRSLVNERLCDIIGKTQIDEVWDKATKTKVKKYSLKLGA